MTDGDEYFYEALIMRSETKQLEMRRVIGMMQFIGDAGGINSSLFLLGAALNFIFSGKDQALQLLADHFFVNSLELVEGESNVRSWLSGYTLVVM